MERGYTAKAIEAARHKRGLTKADLSRRVNVSRMTITNWERGTAYPKQENLDALADALQVERRSLLVPDDAVGFHQQPIAGRLARDQWLGQRSKNNYGFAPISFDHRFPTDAQSFYVMDDNSGGERCPQEMVLHVIRTETMEPLANDQLVIVERKKNDLTETTLRQLKRIGDNLALLWLDSQAESPEPLGKDVSIEGVVIAGWKQFA